MFSDEHIVYYNINECPYDSNKGVDFSKFSKMMPHLISVKTHTE